MSVTVKCNECNIVIDEMLSYIQNKLSVIDEETLVRLCMSAFTGAEIQNSKSLLFEAVPTDKQIVQRRGDKKEHRDINDIINLFRTADPSSIPVFVARQLEKLPPLTFDHLDCTKLLKDIVRLQADMNSVKATYVTLNELEDLRQEVRSMKNIAPPKLSICNINGKRGASYLDSVNSGPMGMSHLHNSTLNETNDSNKDESSSHPIENEGESAKYRSIILAGSNSENIIVSSPQPAEVVAPRAMSQSGEQLTIPAQPQGMNLLTRELSYANMLTMNEKISQNHKDLKDNWQTVQHKKKANNRFNGQAGTASVSHGNFKAAERRIPMFITKISKDADESEITDYILQKTKETVLLEKIKIRNEQFYSAYKFFVDESKMSIFLNSNIWPKDIIFRKFVHYKHKQPYGAGSGNGNVPN